MEKSLIVLIRCLSGDFLIIDWLKEIVDFEIFFQVLFYLYWLHMNKKVFYLNSLLLILVVIHWKSVIIINLNK